MKPRLSKFGDYERRVDFQAFGYAVFVVFSADVGKSISSRYPAIRDGGNYGAMHCHEKGNPYSHLFFKVGDCYPGTIAHESWHAMRYMLLDWAGCNVDSENIAYHLGYLVDRVHLLKNELIDNGIGVKSKTQEAPNENHSQGVVSRVPGVQSRFDRESQGEEILPTEAHRGSVSGRCCP